MFARLLATYVSENEQERAEPGKSGAWISCDCIFLVPRSFEKRAGQCEVSIFQCKALQDDARLLTFKNKVTL